MPKQNYPRNNLALLGSSGINHEPQSHIQQVRKKLGTGWETDPESVAIGKSDASHLDGEGTLNVPRKIPKKNRTQF